MCRRALDSGAALERLRAVIERQGGDPRVIDDYTLMPQAAEEHVVRAGIDGFVTDLDAGLIGRAVVVLGGGRDEVDDEIDHGVGVSIAASVGDAVRAGDPVMRVRYTSDDRLEDALPLLMSAMRVGESPQPRSPLVIEEVR
jgi:pyrimidine-nucleoside phosphorylase